MKLVLSGKNKVLPIDRSSGKVIVEEPSLHEKAVQACKNFVENPGTFTMRRAVKALRELGQANGLPDEEIG